MSILDEIFAHKRAEVVEQQQAVPLTAVQAAAEARRPPLDFVAALRQAARPALIAEIKQASPSRGVMARDFDPLRLARLYTANGAAAISVLTDERYFRGSLEHLRLVAAETPRLPLLRKDFVCDPYQLYQARAAGADAILLIVAGLAPAQLRDLHDLAGELGLAALVEVHTAAELDAALAIGPRLVGINNRNLHDFTVRLETTLDLRPAIPPGICVIAESGIRTRADVARLAAAGVDAILVGEALVSAPDVAAAVRELTDRQPSDLASARSGMEASAGFMVNESNRLKPQVQKIIGFMVNESNRLKPQVQKII